MDEAQPTNIAPSAAPDTAQTGDTHAVAISSSPPSSTVGTTSTRPPRGRNGRRQSAPATQDERLTASLSEAYDRASKGEAVLAPGEPTPAEIFGRRDAAVDALTADFDNLPAETKEYIRQAIDRPPMPQAWGQDKSELWGKLDRSAQEYIAERELQAQQKISELGNQAKASSLDEVIGKYSAHIPRGPDGQAMSPPAVLESLLQAHYTLEQNPAAAIQFLAQNYGLDLAQMAFDPVAHQQAEMQRQQVVAQYENVIRQLDYKYQALQQQYAQAQQQRLAYVQQEAAKFFEGKEWSSDLEQETLHQVAALRDRNPSLYHADPLSVLREAHTRALKVLGMQAKQDQVEAKKRADQAKRLSELNVRTHGLSHAPGAASQGMFANDTWDAAYARAQKRGS